MDIKPFELLNMFHLPFFLVIFMIVHKLCFFLVVAGSSVLGIGHVNSTNAIVFVFLSTSFVFNPNLTGV